MRIALLNEFSQAAKNTVIFQELSAVTQENGHHAYNLGMKDDNDHYLTYLNLGVMASLLINTDAVDFIITGCGTGQGALAALNAFPGVVCGYCIEPTDAFLFAQINNGNALSIPYAKGFGWGAELNLNNIFRNAFGSERGQGYPQERKESQNRNAANLFVMKQAIAKDYLQALKAIDQTIVRESVLGKDFQKYFFENCKDDTIRAYIESLISQ
ncbi:RpiB/LacA/LacB family sugar-phosphate isomerase [Erysipelothrix sp. HDW6C]|uniref:RpiB/LacA/LacB family sugar-phosphate isomerase n=1 Tax=Erysipelothrix sp. HDW6C TaxID=2714930 RepID=UPI001407A102|nr:RpiB/LacA/LacB family sugar-phosphate isomerase [Erysipelothrix sp. HDW6C]QIK69273.1 RpiB/LacA/LacB family sugar-phosphate isomerase [Erysipelothrix sp. HDW6C]